jgi:hypothetical protein
MSSYSSLVDSILDFVKDYNQKTHGSSSHSHHPTEEVVDFKDTQGNVVLTVPKSRAENILRKLNEALDSVRKQIAISDNLTQGESRVIARNARVLKSKKSKGGKSTKKRKSAKKKVTKKRNSAKKNKK